MSEKACLFIYEDVRWLEIAMDDAVLDELYEPVEYVIHKPESFLLGHGGLFGHIGFEELIQVPAVAILLNDVVVVVGFHHVHQLDDVGALQLLHDLYLLNQSFPQIVVSNYIPAKYAFMTCFASILIATF